MSVDINAIVAVSAVEHTYAQDVPKSMLKKDASTAQKRLDHSLVAMYTYEDENAVTFTKNSHLFCCRCGFNSTFV